MKHLLPLIMILAAAPVMGQSLNYSAGAGSLFGEEDQTFDLSNVFASAQIEALQIPFRDAASGASVEVSGLKGDFSYALYALNRAKVAGPVYGGVDVKVFANGQGDFDVRAVLVYNVAKQIALEIYSLEESKPIAFALFYRF